MRQNISIEGFVSGFPSIPLADCVPIEIDEMKFIEIK